MLDKIQTSIYDFLEDANDIIPNDFALYYSGSFLSGNIQAPDYLFISINPGFGRYDWDARSRKFQRKPFTLSTCKYVEEFEDKYDLAKEIVEIILNGDSSRLEACAETYALSFFATPDQKILDASLRASGLATRHQALMAEALLSILKIVSPKQVVCIGLSSFQMMLNLLGDKNQGVEMKSVKSASGKTDPVYYKKTKIQGVPFHGVLHLSGAQLSNIMRKELKEIFSPK